MSTPARFTLKPGTPITVDGVEAQLVGEAVIEAAGDRHEALARYTTEPAFQEYPKMVNAGGVEKIVHSAEEEALWCHPPQPDAAPDSEPARADPLDDVSVEMDNPDLNEPPKKKGAAKKK